MSDAVSRPEVLTALIGTFIVVVVLALDPNGLVAVLDRVASCKGTDPGYVGGPTRHSVSYEVVCGSSSVPGGLLG